MTKVRYIWASPHKPTKEQMESIEGKLEFLPEHLQNQINNCPDSTRELEALAEKLLQYTGENENFLFQPGGSPAFQFILGKNRGFRPVKIFYAYSERVSRDIPQEDGSIKKISSFKFERWIEV